MIFLEITILMNGLVCVSVTLPVLVVAGESTRESEIHSCCFSCSKCSMGSNERVDNSLTLLKMTTNINIIGVTTIAMILFDIHQG